jgi:phosphoglycerol transferase MdoB-like AlkP superfamily enzyme
MPQEEALKYFNKDHLFAGRDSFWSMNVVIIILESFSSEYIGAFNNGKGYTPFLDSLMKESLTFRHAYANAKKSIDGIPAVLAALPTLMPDSYISSPYNSNRLKSIAGILKSKGYSSAFFHGGNNGTMNFDNFTLISGFENYYGRREYPGTEYDGHWGVYDEPFYYFFLDKCSSMKQPFVNVFFTLSSHHPYSIPDHLKGRFPKGPLPIHESIGYADYALSKFFEKARTMPWFENTLFVLTSDHTGPAANPYYNTKSGIFRVPVVFYHPSGYLKGWPERITQQTDIVPGILDLLNYDEPFTAFGNSPFDTTAAPFAINFTGDAYHILDGRYMIQFDGTEVTGYYDYRKDPYLLINRQDSVMPSDPAMLHTMKSVLQQYNRALIRNELTPSGS